MNDREQDKQAGGPEPKDFVMLSEASFIAHVHLHGLDSTVSELRRNEMATFLARIARVFMLSDDGQPLREVTMGELRDGRFADWARRITFGDGRPPIENVAITRSGLREALETLDQVAPRRRNA